MQPLNPKTSRIETIYLIVNSAGKSIDWSIKKEKAENMAENLTLLTGEKHSVKESRSRHEILKHK